MSIVEVSGAVTKLEANKFGFYQVNLKGDDGEWHNNISLGVKQPPKTFQKGSRISLSYDTDNYNNLVKDSLTVLEAESKPQGGGYQKKGGYQGGGKKPFTDNTIGMGIGAALNNATQLFIGGKIKEAEIPVAMANLYELSEAMKQAATADTLQATASEYNFSLSGSSAKQNTAKKAPAKTAAKKAAEPEPKPEQDFDDDIPF